MNRNAKVGTSPRAALRWRAPWWTLLATLLLAAGLLAGCGQDRGTATPVRLDGDPSGGSAPSAPPGTAATVTATVDDTGVHLRWDPVPGATDYTVYRSGGTGGAPAAPIASVRGTSYDDTTGLDGVTYGYSVAAANRRGEGPASHEVGGRARSAVPGAPFRITVTNGDGQVTLSWPDASGAESYVLYFSTEPGVTKATAQRIAPVSSPYVHAPLANGTTYYYALAGVNHGGNESPLSAEVMARPMPPPLPPPTGLSASPGDGRVTLSWDAVAGATGYALYWSTEAGVTPESGARIDVAASPFVHTGLTNGTPYHYVLTAVDDFGQSAPSAEAVATPAAGAALPDLVVSQLEVLSYSGTSISYRYTITNVGAGPAWLDGPTDAEYDNVSVQAFVSADEVFANSGDIAAGGTILGLSPLGWLEPGQSFTGQFSSGTTLDLATHPYLTLKVDWGQVVDESDETNNTAAVLIQVAPPEPPPGGLPDLVVSQLEVLSYSGTSISYRYTITNVGAGPAWLDGPTDAEYDNVSVQAFVSADEVFANSGDIAAGGTILGLSPLGWLEPGQSFTGQFSSGTTLDVATHPYLTLKVDWGQVVDESDETNNTLAVPIQPAPTVTAPVRTVSGGTCFTHAILADGSLWSWGCGSSGALGMVVSGNAYTPTRVGTGTSWRFLAPGGQMAIQTDGSLWVWGPNFYGQLGLGHVNTVYEPTRVGSGAWHSAAMGGGAGVGGHALAIGGDGSLWAWGLDDSGQLGIGTGNAPDTCAPTSILAPCATLPMQVGTDTDWSQVAAGRLHSIGLKADGSLWGWGNNLHGELGLGDTADRDVPTRIGTDTDWVYVAAGYFHTLAVKADGTLWSWGTNTSQQLGQPADLQSCPETSTGRCNLIPRRVGSDSDWAAVAGGYYQSVAIKTDGSRWGWGGNAQGQLGLGDLSLHAVPTPAGPGPAFGELTTGFWHGLAVDADGVLWAWGANYSGQLGLGLNPDATMQTCGSYACTPTPYRVVFPE